jgi:hypothetical protein
MVARATLTATTARLAEAEARIRKLEAQAQMQGWIMAELINETGATPEQIVAASLRACGIDPALRNPEADEDRAG